MLIGVVAIGHDEKKEPQIHANLARFARSANRVCCFVALIPPDSGGLVAIANATANAGRRQSGAVIVEDVDAK
ncbi:hypothetical protein McpCs1_18370 [Methanocorpusculaceae archaeon Cs1]|uniref:Uncharacterized protein n=1 Tax=Methanorbis rubei TaxID=3028300 RepID=A0AAE4SCA7_9EURY|nr:hypothetical protein [Methanocorpusculaceae archaeon Cs1]